MKGKTVVCDSKKLIGELCEKAQQLCLGALGVIYRRGLRHFDRLKTFAMLIDMGQKSSKGGGDNHLRSIDP